MILLPYDIHAPSSSSYVYNALNMYNAKTGTSADFDIENATIP